MATNTPSSVYKPLHEYQIPRVSNSPHLCELCTTLSVVEQHIYFARSHLLPNAPLALSTVKFGCERRAVARTQPSKPLCATHFFWLACPRGAARTKGWPQGLQFRPVPPGTGGTYRSARLPVRGPPATGRFPQKSTVGGRFRPSVAD
ncbi:hypothetical protein BHM03_00039895 [Ensete ventricosum]|nr:hypothetical protein BHM03_00039895 [Ensete ventricosum]